MSADPVASRSCTAYRCQSPLGSSALGLTGVETCVRTFLLGAMITVLLLTLAGAIAAAESGDEQAASRPAEPLREHEIRRKRYVDLITERGREGVGFAGMTASESPRKSTRTVRRQDRPAYAVVSRWLAVHDQSAQTMIQA